MSRDTAIRLRRLRVAGPAAVAAVAAVGMLFASAASSISVTPVSPSTGLVMAGNPATASVTGLADKYGNASNGTDFAYQVTPPAGQGSVVYGKTASGSATATIPGTLTHAAGNYGIALYTGTDYQSSNFAVIGNKAYGGFTLTDDVTSTGRVISQGQTIHLAASGIRDQWGNVPTDGSGAQVLPSIRYEIVHSSYALAGKVVVDAVLDGSINADGTAAVDFVVPCTVAIGDHTIHAYIFRGQQADPVHHDAIGTSGSVKVLNAALDHVGITFKNNTRASGANVAGDSILATASVYDKCGNLTNGTYGAKWHEVFPGRDKFGFIHDASGTADASTSASVGHGSWDVPNTRTANWATPASFPYSVSVTVTDPATNSSVSATDASLVFNPGQPQGEFYTQVGDGSSSRIRVGSSNGYGAYYVHDSYGNPVAAGWTVNLSFVQPDGSLYKDSTGKTLFPVVTDSSADTSATGFRVRQIAGDGVTVTSDVQTPGGNALVSPVTFGNNHLGSWRLEGAVTLAGPRGSVNVATGSNFYRLDSDLAAGSFQLSGPSRSQAGQNLVVRASGIKDSHGNLATVGTVHLVPSLGAATLPAVDGIVNADLAHPGLALITIPGTSLTGTGALTGSASIEGASASGAISNIVAAPAAGAIAISAGDIAAGASNTATVAVTSGYSVTGNITLKVTSPAGASTSFTLPSTGGTQTFDLGFAGNLAGVYSLTASGKDGSGNGIGGLAQFSVTPGALAKMVLQLANGTGLNAPVVPGGAENITAYLADAYGNLIDLSTPNRQELIHITAHDDQFGYTAFDQNVSAVNGKVQLTLRGTQTAFPGQYQVGASGYGKIASDSFQVVA